MRVCLSANAAATSVETTITTFSVGGLLSGAFPSRILSFSTKKLSWSIVSEQVHDFLHALDHEVQRTCLVCRSQNILHVHVYVVALLSQIK